MLIKDEAAQVRGSQEDAVHQHQNQIRSWIMDKLSDCVYLEDSASDPTLIAKQIGKPLPVGEVERRFQRLVPSLRFEVIPNGREKKMMFQVLPDGTPRKVMVYEDGLVPERSIMRRKTEEVPDVNLYRPDGRIFLDRADLPKHEIIPHKFDEEGNLQELGRVVWDDTVPAPGFKKVEVPWSEWRRGYRTMCAILVDMGLITPSQAETAFGSDDTLHWARKMGKRETARLW